MFPRILNFSHIYIECLFLEEDGEADFFEPAVGDNLPHEPQSAGGISKILPRIYSSNSYAIDTAVILRTIWERLHPPPNKNTLRTKENGVETRHGLTS